MHVFLCLIVCLFYFVCLLFFYLPVRLIGGGLLFSAVFFFAYMKNFEPQKERILRIS